MLSKKLIYLLLVISPSQELYGQRSFRNSSNNIVEAIPFTLTSHNNISIKAIIGDGDTLDLMFHTAANSVTLTRETTSRLEGISWDEESDVGTWGGRAVWRSSNNNRMRIGPLKWDSLTIYEDERSGPTTDGKFGPHLFKGYFIEIDFKDGLLVLYEKLPEKSKEYLKMNLVNIDGNLFVEGKTTIDGMEYENLFLIHSGYGGALLFDDQFAVESKIGERIAIVDQKELRDSFGNVVKVKKGLLPNFKLGNIELIQVPVGFYQGQIGQQQMSIIGGDVLKRFNMIIDADRESIYIKTNDLTKLDYTEF
ncbi:hypothetical protein SAMN05661096_02422 [Marivirga sericea]|uniref:Aspartyl protease n=1 Tax=Marivirga sericea TaxID=1028 RepID=A0A1X7K5G3_9BACT|nr:hypothetical protein [Marivirga sericea]SMG36270.1 hypothetical protein SAMN05661096_02422 [Marivirga sericea]